MRIPGLAKKIGLSSARIEDDLLNEIEDRDTIPDGTYHALTIGGEDHIALK
jgi:hypothetical protein